MCQAQPRAKRSVEGSPAAVDHVGVEPALGVEEGVPLIHPGEKKKCI